MHIVQHQQQSFVHYVLTFQRERFIISDYYGLDGVKPKTLDEIGEEFNLTKERVRQLNEKALRKMRSNALLKNLSFTGF